MFCSKREGRQKIIFKVMSITGLLVILSLFTFTIQSPHILDNVEMCEISYILKKKIKYHVPLYITAEDSNIQLMFSLCGYIPPDVYPNIGFCSRTCIFNKQLNSLITGKQNINTLFDLEEHKSNQVTLILTDKLKCENSGNDTYYTIIVRMVESFELFKKPIIKVDGCNIVVEMMKPDYEPPCTKLVESKNFINLIPLKGKNIVIPWEGSEFNIAICGTNKHCGAGTTGCQKLLSEKKNNTMNKLGETSLQKVKFDDQTDELKIVSSYKKGRKKGILELILKCDWEVETFSNAKFINQSFQGRTYKFEVDSSYGCVKMASNCLIEDRDNNLIYDLRGLTEETGTKVKINSTKKNLLMHICGDLKGLHIQIDNSENECEKQHSQICEIDRNVYINKGSIPTYEITNQHNVKILLRNGQRCGEKSYSTEIDIICSLHDKGPIVMKSENCSTKILWETPKGCPKFQSEEDGCAIKTHLGVINIANLYNENDTIQLFSDSDKFMFNICGKLHKTCSSENEVSACYISNGTEYVIGWNNPKFSYINGKLQQKYYGTKCKNANKYSSLTINFYCSYAKLYRNKIYRRDSCTFEADIYSLSACLNTNNEDCKVENDGVKYNLNPLKANESNYEIRDKNDENLIFFLNVCRSLINENGLIAGNSMIYLLDKSKPHIWYRYKSLGKIAGPTVTRDGKLVINSNLGSTCQLGTDYTSVIHFECSDTNEKPELFKKRDCKFEFLWRTSYACPQSICFLEGGTVVPEDEVKFEIHGNMYNFSLCSEFYGICKFGNCETHQLTRIELLRNSREYVEVKLKNSTACSKESLTVNIDLQCDPSKTHSEVSILAISQDSCRVDLLMKSLFVCRNGSHFVKEKVEKLPRNAQSKLYKNPAGFTDISDIEVEEHYIKKETNLTKGYENLKLKNNLVSQQNKEHSVFTSDIKILEPPGGLENQKYYTVKIGIKTFDLKNIQAFNVTGKDTYIINFNGASSNCAGRICRNLTPILSFIENCPEVFTFENHVVLNFTAEGKCLINDTTKIPRTADLKIKIGLECSGESSSMTLSDETNCFIGFTYYSPQNCDFIKSSNGFSVITLFIGLIFLLISLVLGYIFYKKNRASCSYNTINNSERAYFNHSKLL